MKSLRKPKIRPSSNHLSSQSDHILYNLAEPQKSYSILEVWYHPKARCFGVINLFLFLIDGRQSAGWPGGGAGSHDMLPVHQLHLNTHGRRVGMDVNQLIAYYQFE